MNITVLYYTDNSFEHSPFAEIVRARIRGMTNAPIISVSQEPLNFGKNLCIGKIGRSLPNIIRQIIMGLKEVETPYVALTEHDTLYPNGYFNWLPQKDDVFYYADNTIWAIAKKGPQYGQFMTHSHQRPSYESLVCNTKLLLNAMNKRIKWHEDGVDLPRGWMEPGYAYDDEKYEMRSCFPPVIDIRHNDCYTMRDGGMDKLFWEAEGWGRFEDIT